MVELILQYAINHHIILNINEKDFYGRTPLYIAINNNNIKMAKILVEYATKNDIKLYLEGKEINKKENLELIMYMFNIGKKNKSEIHYSYESILSKVFGTMDMLFGNQLKKRRNREDDNEDDKDPVTIKKL
ncbi:hypothetical protein PIROE2DRAFT_12315 [Piromyces sp. E2]|nr:hypothetical protein PIROE2DRAFT_12315 [Piromyces sp. E2]|eukprot:OUM61621.1 hypothetical protein PIROE2DRAFT_12315 [Piromyces sp. E2]